MTARAPIAFLPHRLRVADAAAFCGETIGTFRQKVADGRMPKPAWRDKRNVYWRTKDLIDAMESDPALDEVSRKTINSVDLINARTTR